MADTRIQLEVEDWVRDEWMPQHFGQSFSRRRIKLRSGGVFDADAVSLDGKIAAAISTSGARTSGGKGGSGKMNKIRSDMYFLLLANLERRVLVFTEKDMYDHMMKERIGGRLASEIECTLAEIPATLNERLVGAKLKASGEMSGRK